jgi:hypothetical protein
MLYLASFIPHHDGGDGYTVTFVDFPDIRIWETDLETAFKEAGRQLQDTIDGMPAETIPEPSGWEEALQHLETRKAGFKMWRQAFVNYIQCVVPT